MTYSVSATVAGRLNCNIEAYDDTFGLCFFMQLLSHLMHPHVFSSGVDIGCGVVDAGLDDLSTVPTKGLFIVSDTPSLIKSSLGFRSCLLTSCLGIS